jgi:thioredoxin 1
MAQVGEASDRAMENRMAEGFVVICLCAQWCGTCRDYRAGFDGLAAEFPGVNLRWLDIEEQADDLGDLDVENFPTLFIRRGESVLFFGTMLPHLSYLRRLIETFLEQSPEQSRDYARSTPERRLWQENPDLQRLGRG